MIPCLAKKPLHHEAYEIKANVLYYKIASGERINAKKYEIYFFNYNGKKQRISLLLGCNREPLLGKDQKEFMETIAG